MNLLFFLPSENFHSEIPNATYKEFHQLNRSEPNQATQDRKIYIQEHTGEPMTNIKT